MAVVAPRPASTHPSRDDHQDGLVQDGLAVDLEDLGQAAAVGAHETDSSEAAAISNRRPIWAGKPSTLPWSPAPAPATYRA